MSDLIRDSFNRFYQSIDGSYQTLNSHRVHIEDRKSKMISILTNGVQIPDMPKSTGEYQNLCREMMRTVGDQLVTWRDLIRKQIERSEFVNRHEKSILALVFADVNAGKSSLGNFVGGWNLQNTAYADLYCPHDCIIEAYSAASKENRNLKEIDHFEENATEATSTIQYYTLQQGLTWVDTPGLHSLTEEHGELAQEYIEFADLVVYLTPSSSPFKIDEREMLGKLFKMGKPVILAITKSDIVEEDEDIAGNTIYKRIPKSAHDRQAQEDYVTRQAREIGGHDNLENSHVLSLSVMLARDAVANQSPQLYEASNLPQFLSQMGNILSANAIDLKMRRPKAEVNSFINRLIGTDGVEERDFLTITQLKAELAKRQDALKKFSATCREDEPAICANIDQMLPVKLSSLFRSLRDRKLLGDVETVSREASEEISKLAVEVCKDRLLDKLGSQPLALALPKLSAKTDSSIGYEVQHQSQTITEQVERAPKGPLEKLVHLVSKDTKFYKTISHTEEIATGDNFNTFLDAQVESLRPDVRKYVSTVIGHMISACFDPLLDCYQQLDEQLEHLAVQLESLRFTEK